ncbi:MAG TPA: DUF4149 domain-containing protein [Terriglobales bacterium]
MSDSLRSIAACYYPAMPFLRFLMLLSLIVWLGGLIFFAFGVAPTLFAVLPTRHMAGSVVQRSLTTLHWMGIVSGIVFLIASLIYARMTTGTPHIFAARNVMIVLMLVLTLVSQFGIMPKMVALRNQMVVIDNVPPTDPARVEFDSLHVWSTRVEELVLLLALVVTYMTAQVGAR